MDLLTYSTKFRVDSDQCRNETANQTCVEDTESQSQSAAPKGTHDRFTEAFGMQA